MDDLVSKANKIIYLVDKHGEVNDCHKDQCEICDEIKRIRQDIGKDERDYEKRLKFIKGINHLPSPVSVEHLQQ